MALDTYSSGSTFLVRKSEGNFLRYL